MTPLNQLKAVECALEPTASASVSQSASGMGSFFFGPRGAARRLAVADLHCIPGSSVWRSRSGQPRRPLAQRRFQRVVRRIGDARNLAG